MPEVRIPPALKIQAKKLVRLLTAPTSLLFLRKRKTEAAIYVCFPRRMNSVWEICLLLGIRFKCNQVSCLIARTFRVNRRVLTTYRARCVLQLDSRCHLPVFKTALGLHLDDPLMQQH